ncbi:hypothetical protein [Spirosoma foliorum]|uniref:Uncharacterized protein n=1 Tax=Spirosoma foliorum TaxID=2710596 RepID=A0A7G5H6H3_9BACT|nr:hypothetical protein [Spirosoma foliorum]QMW06715.1 hypothetical protein H3H32_18385 [Spirosoma foliorum]
MTQTKFEQNCLLIGQLEFVDTVSIPTNVPLVFVELSPRLVSLVPMNLAYLWFNLNSFTVAHVMDRYERHLQNLKKHGFNEAYQVGNELFDKAKPQVSILLLCKHTDGLNGD